jgi:competence CoiA-like predicted nuclease
VEQRQGVALLTGDVTAGFDTCPLCGNKLAPKQGEQAQLHLRNGSISA